MLHGVEERKCLVEASCPWSHDPITSMSVAEASPRPAEACTDTYHTAHIYQRIDAYVGAYMWSASLKRMYLYLQMRCTSKKERSCEREKISGLIWLVSTLNCHAKPIKALVHSPIFLTPDDVLESWQYSQRAYPHFDYPPKPILPGLTRFALAVRPAILHLHPRCWLIGRVSSMVLLPC